MWISPEYPTDLIIHTTEVVHFKVLNMHHHMMVTWWSHDMTPIHPLNQLTVPSPPQTRILSLLICAYKRSPNSGPPCVKSNTCDNKQWGCKQVQSNHVYLRICEFTHYTCTYIHMYVRMQLCPPDTSLGLASIVITYVHVSTCSRKQAIQTDPLQLSRVALLVQLNCFPSVPLPFHSTELPCHIKVRWISL